MQSSERMKMLLDTKLSEYKELRRTDGVKLPEQNENQNTQSLLCNRQLGCFSC